MSARPRVLTVSRICCIQGDGGRGSSEAYMPDSGMVAYGNPEGWTSLDTLSIVTCEPSCSRRREARTVQPLRDLSVLDVGCGGGLFSEALARLGADVTGIDTSATAISVATGHAQADPVVASRTRYQNVTAEQLQQQGTSTVQDLCAVIWLTVSSAWRGSLPGLASPLSSMVMKLWVKMHLECVSSRLQPCATPA